MVNNIPSKPRNPSNPSFESAGDISTQVILHKINSRGKHPSPIPAPEKRADSVDEYVGCFIGDNYKITEKLSAGGMGVLYKGIQLSTNQVVVLKTLREEYIKDIRMLRQFLREKDIIGKLNHPHIVTLLDFVTDKTGPMFIIMEFLKGKPLFEHLQQPHLKFQTVIDILIQIGDGLDFAHSQGIIHRDLKPDNIFLLENPKNFVKILDFGIAKLFEATPDPTVKNTILTGFVGTPQYMSPEQIAGHPVDHKTDIYSFGIILYELLPILYPNIAFPPFDITAFNETTIYSTLNRLLPKTNAARRLTYILSHCLAFHKNNRFKSMRAVVELFENLEKPLESAFSSDESQGSGREKSSAQNNSDPALFHSEKETLPVSRLKDEANFAPPDSGKSKTGYIFGGLFLLVALVSGLFILKPVSKNVAYILDISAGGVLLDKPLPDFGEAKQTAIAVPVRAADSKGAEKASLPMVVKITFQSEPQFVTVHITGKDPLITPFTIEMPRNLAGKVQFTASKIGFVNKSADFVSEENKTVKIKLEKAPANLFQKPAQRIIPPKPVPKKSEIANDWE